MFSAIDGIVNLLLVNDHHHAVLAMLSLCAVQPNWGLVNDGNRV